MQHLEQTPRLGQASIVEMDPGELEPFHVEIRVHMAILLGLGVKPIIDCAADGSVNTQGVLIVVQALRLGTGASEHPVMQALPEAGAHVRVHNFIHGASVGCEADSRPLPPSIISWPANPLARSELPKYLKLKSTTCRMDRTRGGEPVISLASRIHVQFAGAKQVGTLAGLASIAPRNGPGVHALVGCG